MCSRYEYKLKCTHVCTKCAKRGRAHIFPHSDLSSSSNQPQRLEFRARSSAIFFSAASNSSQTRTWFSTKSSKSKHKLQRWTSAGRSIVTSSPSSGAPGLNAYPSSGVPGLDCGPTFKGGFGVYSSSLAAAPGSAVYSSSSVVICGLAPKLGSGPLPALPRSPTTKKTKNSKSR